MGRLFFVSLTLTALLVACGGSGGSDEVAPPSVGTVPPSAGIDSVDHRSAIQAAASANATAAVTLPTVSAGTITVNATTETITFAKTADGRYYGLSDASGTYLVNPADILRVSANSNQLGWDVPGYTSRSSGVPDANGVVQVPRTCNKDIIAWNVHLRDGRILWFDHTSERKWVRTGFASILRSDGLVEYGGYATPTVSAKSGAVVGGQVTVELTIDFQDNCLGGFGKDGKLTDLDPSATPVMFLWNSDKKGWGINRTPVPTPVRPVYDDGAGSYRATFTGLACSDVGNITVYKGSGSNASPVWDPASDGYGAGWFIIQNASDPFQFWKPATNLAAGVSVTFDRTRYQIAYSVPCTAPTGETTVPTVGITGLTAGTVINGATSFCAGASDNVGVVGVQWKLDGVNIGSEVTASPYCVTWNASSSTPGSHTLTATARDAAGNTATSSVAFYAGARTDVLAWIAPGSNGSPMCSGPCTLQSYRVYYGTSPAPKTDPGAMVSPVIPSGTLTYQTPSLNWGTKYYYVVTAVYDIGESGPSGEVSALK